MHGLANHGKFLAPRSASMGLHMFVNSLGWKPGTLRPAWREQVQVGPETKIEFEQAFA
jgi:hypothetical protein